MLFGLRKLLFGLILGINFDRRRTYGAAFEKQVSEREKRGKAVAIKGRRPPPQAAGDVTNAGSTAFHCVIQDVAPVWVDRLGVWAIGFDLKPGDVAVEGDANQLGLARGACRAYPHPCVDAREVELVAAHAELSREHRRL